VLLLAKLIDAGAGDAKRLVTDYIVAGKSSNGLLFAAVDRLKYVHTFFGFLISRVISRSEFVCTMNAYHP
jgi:hypothetical protein